MSSIFQECGFHPFFGDIPSFSPHSFYFWFNEKIPSTVLISSIHIKFILLKAFTHLKNITELSALASVLNLPS
jgi:hypothetical protein